MEAGFDITRARRDTPSCENVLHFNNAGASLMPFPVFDAQIRHLRLEQEMGASEAAERMKYEREDVYDAAARLLHCDLNEIALTENATRAWQSAFQSIPFKAKDVVLFGEDEYSSNRIGMLHAARHHEIVLEVVPNDDSGQMSIPALQESLARWDGRVKLVAVTHMPNYNGVVNPAAEIGAIVKTAGALYLLDGCQSAGQFPLDVRTLQCDFLSATGRKYLRGPRGAGLLYVRRDLIESLEPATLELHSAPIDNTGRYRMRPDARRFETWEHNVAARLGLGAALRYTIDWDIDQVRARIASLSSELRDRLKIQPAVTVHDRGTVQSGIVTFSVADRSAGQIREALLERQMHVSVAPLPPSPRSDAEDVVRASLHYYNTEREIERFCDALERLA